MTIVSRKKIYFWNLLGNVFASGVSVLYLMLVSRLLPVERADQFGLASSIGSIWIVIGLFQVRNFQGTDLTGCYTFKDYFQTRIITIGIMFVTIMPYIYIVGEGQYSTDLIILIILFLLYRAGDALSDVFQGFLQQIDRLDIAGVSMTCRYLISIVSFYIVLDITKSINCATLFLSIFTLLYVIVVEGYVIRRFITFSWFEYLIKWNYVSIVNILKACFPLFINGYLLLSILNQPKIVIEKGLQLGILETGIQRDFNILFMPVFFMSMCILVIRPQITNMAYLWQIKNYKKFSLSLRKMFLILGSLGMFAVLSAYFIGTPILGLIFGIDLSNYVFELTILVFSGILYSIAIVLENILTIFRRHSKLLIAYTLTFVLSLIVYQSFIFKRGLMGAVLAFTIVMGVFLLGVLITYFVVVNHERGTDV